MKTLLSLFLTLSMGGHSSAWAQGQNIPSSTAKGKQIWVHAAEVAESDFQHWVSAHHGLPLTEFISTQDTLTNWEEVNLEGSPNELRNLCEQLLRRPLLRSDLEVWLQIWQRLPSGARNGPLQELASQFQSRLSDPELHKERPLNPAPSQGSSKMINLPSILWIVDGQQFQSEHSRLDDFLAIFPQLKKNRHQWSFIANGQMPLIFVGTADEFSIEFQKSKTGAINIGQIEDFLHLPVLELTATDLQISTLQTDHSKPLSAPGDSTKWWVVPVIAIAGVFLYTQMADKEISIQWPGLAKGF